MYTSQPTRETGGTYSPWLIMGSELNRNLLKKSLDYSNGFTGGTSTREAGSGWRFASAWWSSTGGTSGWSDRLPAKEQPFASPFPCDPDADRQPPNGEKVRSRVQNRSHDEAYAAPGVVLLVEDNPLDVFVIREAIQGSGLNLALQVAANGQEALRYLQDVGAKESSLPVLVLLDLNLPKIAGLDVLRELRGNPAWSQVPVIVVTSSLAGEDCVAAKHLGAEEYFQKPTDLKKYMELSELMQRVLRAPGHN